MYKMLSVSSNIIELVFLNVHAMGRLLRNNITGKSLNHEFIAQQKRKKKTNENIVS